MALTDRGLIQKGSTYYARKAIPAALRPIIGRYEFIETLRTDSFEEAAIRRTTLEREWCRQIASARQSLANRHVDLGEVEATFLRWAELVNEFVPDWSGYEVGLAGPQIGARRWRSEVAMTTPVHISVTMHRLNTELATGRRDFAAIPGFDILFEGVVDLFGISIRRGHPSWDDARLHFADAWLGALRLAEKNRLHHSAVARANEIAAMDVTTFQPVGKPHRTVKDLVESYKADRIARHGEEPTLRKYSHIFKGLEEIVGASKRLQEVTREDCRKVRDTLRKLPVHVGKRFPGLSFTEVFERLDESDDEFERLAPNTVSNYMSNLVAMFNWAIREEWLDKNPASGLVDGDMPVIKRRGFNGAELTKVFGALADDRKANSWKWWIPLIALYSGARANEIAQLKRGDIRRENDVDYFAFTAFDAKGNRSKDKRVKTAASERNVPIHSELIRLGFLEWVATITDPAKPLWPLPPGPNGAYSHELSKWWARHLEAVGLTDPSLVFHSFRHGFRDACETAEISDRLTRALGGWASTSESERYGNAGALPLLKTAISKIDYAGFNAGPK